MEKITLNLFKNWIKITAHSTSAIFRLGLGSGLNFSNFPKLLLIFPVVILPCYGKRYQVHSWWSCLQLTVHAVNWTWLLFSFNCRIIIGFFLRQCSGCAMDRWDNTIFNNIFRQEIRRILWSACWITKISWIWRNFGLGILGFLNSH